MEANIDLSRVTFKSVDSHFIAATAYVPLAAQFRVPGIVDGALLIQFKDGAIWAYSVRSWMHGLLRCGYREKAGEERSVGKAFHRFIRKGKIEGVKIQEGVRNAA